MSQANSKGETEWSKKIKCVGLSLATIPVAVLSIIEAVVRLVFAGIAQFITNNKVLPKYFLITAGVSISQCPNAVWTAHQVLTATKNVNTLTHGIEEYFYPLANQTAYDGGNRV